jgi:hypothetical protein
MRTVAVLTSFLRRGSEKGVIGRGAVGHREPFGPSRSKLGSCMLLGWKRETWVVGDSERKREAWSPGKPREYRMQRPMMPTLTMVFTQALGAFFTGQV